MGTASRAYTKVPIRGDGTGAECTVVVNGNSKSRVCTVSSGGSGYTYGTVNSHGGGAPTGTNFPVFNVIIPPQGDMVLMSIENLEQETL